MLERKQQQQAHQPTCKTERSALTLCSLRRIKPVSAHKRQRQRAGCSQGISQSLEEQRIEDVATWVFVALRIAPLVRIEQQDAAQGPHHGPVVGRHPLRSPRLEKVLHKLLAGLRSAQPEM